MNLLEERAIRNSLRGWIDELERNLPEALRDDDYWHALAEAGRSASTQRDAALVADAAAWLHEAVLPAINDDAHRSGFGHDWQAFNTHRTIDAARKLRAQLDLAIAAAHVDAKAATAAHQFTCSAASATSLAHARSTIDRLTGIRRVVAIAAYDRTVAGSAAAATALLQTYPDRIDLLATIDPIGALLIFTADVGADPVLMLD